MSLLAFYEIHFTIVLGYHRLIFPPQIQTKRYYLFKNSVENFENETAHHKMCSCLHMSHKYEYYIIRTAGGIRKLNVIRKCNESNRNFVCQSTSVKSSGIICFLFVLYCVSECVAAGDMDVLHFDRDESTVVVIRWAWLTAAFE